MGIPLQESPPCLLSELNAASVDGNRDGDGDGDDDCNCDFAFWLKSKGAGHIQLAVSVLTRDVSALGRSCLMAQPRSVDQTERLKEKQQKQDSAYICPCIYG